MIKPRADTFKNVSQFLIFSTNLQKCSIYFISYLEIKAKFKENFILSMLSSNNEGFTNRSQNQKSQKSQFQIGDERKNENIQVHQDVGFFSCLKQFSHIWQHFFVVCLKSVFFLRYQKFKLRKFSFSQYLIFLMFMSNL